MPSFCSSEIQLNLIGVPEMTIFSPGPDFDPEEWANHYPRVLGCALNSGDEIDAS